jgi:sacsin
VKNSGNTAIKNQMAAYQSVMENQEQSLDGTIIRIPLRSKAQAIKSEICSRETTTSAVLEVLQNFAAEFGNSGLLFMRSVERVRIESTAGMSIEINIVNREKVKV